MSDFLGAPTSGTIYSWWLWQRQPIESARVGGESARGQMRAMLFDAPAGAGDHTRALAAHALLHDGIPDSAGAP